MSEENTNGQDVAAEEVVTSTEETATPAEETEAPAEEEVSA